MTPDIQKYHARLSEADHAICDRLEAEITRGLRGAEAKVWHAHPVWFLEGNPIVGYSRQKAGIRLMFWSGADFDEPGLDVLGAKFKDASCFYTDVAEIKPTALRRWLTKARKIQWDYKNIVKRRGKLLRIDTRGAVSSPRADGRAKPRSA